MAVTGGDERRPTVGILGRTGAGGYGHQLDLGFAACERTRVVAVADPDERGRADCAARTGAERAYADYEELLERERPDIAVVAPRWPDCHPEMVRAALHHGAHVYCEKPLAQDLHAADGMVRAAEDADRVLAVALPFVHEPRSGLLLDPERRPDIGDVLEVRGVCKWDGRGGGEDFLVLGLHFADMLRRLLGPAQWCEASVSDAGRPVTVADARPGGERVGPVAGDSVVAIYGFAGGVTATIVSHRVGIGDRDRQPYRLEVRGTKGLLVVRAPYADHSVWHYPEPVVWPADGAAWRRVPAEEMPSYAAYHRLAADDLVAAIRERREPRCNGRDGVAALEMILAAYAAHLAGGRARLPLDDRAHPMARPGSAPDAGTPA